MDLTKAIKNAQDKLNRITGDEQDRDRLEYSAIQIGARLYMQTLILGLRRKGWNNTEISKYLNDEGIECTGHTVGVWLSGKGGSPQIQRIDALELLHNAAVKKEAKAAWKGR